MNGDNANKRTEDMSAARMYQTERRRIRGREYRRARTARIIRRALAVFFVLLLILIGSLYAALYTIAHGPSETVRNMLVLSAKQASATKWVPSLFLPAETVNKILADSEVVSVDEIDMNDYIGTSVNGSVGHGGSTAADEWADAADGMRLEIVTGSTFKAYVILIKDPSRVFVGVSTDDFASATEGMRLFPMVEKYGAVAAINAGEFPDNGYGTGEHPIGITYSQGKCLWNDGCRRTFMGFDKNNTLIVRESMTKKEAEALGIRDAVCFQNGNLLIDNENGSVRLYYADNNTGTAQRTAIAQRADGTVIFLVTDGRSASSLGATKNDVIDLLVKYGAVSAGMLDGGSSAMMYMKDYAQTYKIDESTLDEYQKKGMVNKYKAFSEPRRIPTYFLVSPLAESGVSGQ